MSVDGEEQLEKSSLRRRQLTDQGAGQLDTEELGRSQRPARLSDKFTPLSVQGQKQLALSQVPPLVASPAPPIHDHYIDIEQLSTWQQCTASPFMCYTVLMEGGPRCPKPSTYSIVLIDLTVRSVIPAKRTRCTTPRRTLILTR